MRGNRPKSYALCQTKIYAAIIMAVAVIGGLRMLRPEVFSQVGWKTESKG
ncbi:hypothetical protein PSP20601_02832 [Pandoraea sputorum]|nr:hypothetical protein PSP20601_02832 [Pandoraea sputorum]